MRWQGTRRANTAGLPTATTPTSRRGSPSGRARRRWSRRCRSSTRTIISGTRRSAARYLLPELLDDIGGGHNIVSTVFLECRSMYRKDGPAEMAPVGEVEFVNGIAAMSASACYGPCRVAEAIIGHADLTLGARVREVLEAEIRVGGGRFRGIRHGVSWDERRRDPEIRHPRRAAASGARPQIPRGLCPARPARAQLRILAIPSAIAGRDRSRPRLSATRRSSSTMSAACSVSGPIAAVDRRSSPAGRRTSPNSPNARTSTSSSAVSA